MSGELAAGEPRQEPEQPGVVQWDLQCKWYVNGFPKSGTHLAAMMLAPLARPMPSAAFRELPWCSLWQDTFKQTTRPWPQLAWHLSELQPGRQFKAHCGYANNIEALQWCLGYCHVFVYRDLRDVAVSQMYHILSDKPEVLIHSGRERFLALGSKEAILSAVITGLEEWPGLLERWGAYAPWLDVDWVHPFQYERAVGDLVGAADGLVRYALSRVGEIFGLRLEQPDTGPAVEQMVASARDTQKSLTFRTGRVGDWRHEFSAEHRRLFKERDTQGWLIRLGYASDQDW